jgi:hypothetical protein
MSFWAEGEQDLDGFDWSEHRKNSVIGPELEAGLQQDAARKRLGLAAGAANTWAPTATAAQSAATTVGRSDLEPRGYQSNLASNLEAISKGYGGGVAESAARAGMNSGMAANNALAATRQVPGGAASAMRNAGNTNDAMAAGGENRIAAIRAQEQLAAQGALGQTLGGMRQQDFGMSAEQARLSAQLGLANAGFNQQTGLANQTAWQQGYGLKQQALGNQMGFDNATFQNNMASRRQDAGIEGWKNDLQTAREERQAAQTGAAIGAAGDWWANAQNLSTQNQKQKQDPWATTSDREQKRDIVSGESRIRDLLEMIAGDCQ